MPDPTHTDIERLLWFVHDECHDFMRMNNESSVSERENFNRLFLAIADLAKSLAGGYREGGLRQ